MEHIKRVMHGESKTRLYRIWSNLKNRVLPNSVKAKYYFDKGIGLCDEWKNSFISFRDWSINNGYDDKLTIDRIDNNLGYSPENCRWVDMKVQANNRSNNITVYADKACVPFSDVCRILGVDYKTAYDKIIMNLVANKNSSNIGKGEQKPADKKEHKFKVGDEIKAANEESLTITKIDDKGYWSVDLFICDFDEECLWDLVEQKPAWSEEDENNINSIVSRLEVDISYWESRSKTRTNEDKKLINWLKSLRPQSQWKPSDEQMEYLAKAIAPDQFKDELTAKEKMLASFTTEELETELKRRLEL